MGCLKLAHLSAERHDTEENKTVLRCVWKSGEPQKTHVSWYDYGARFYDPAIGRWISEDPLAEGYVSESPYHFSGNNPVRFLDLNGMNYDDFYFTQDGRLVEYVENDDPDRVFVAKYDEDVTENLKDNATNQEMYDKVEISDKEIQEKMNDNGYKKVTSEVEVENNQVETRYLMGYRQNRSSMSVITGLEISKGIDTKYVLNDQVATGRYDTEYQMFETAYNPISNQIATYEIYTEKISYGNKNKIVSGFKKIFEFGISLSGNHDQRKKKKVNIYE